MQHVLVLWPYMLFSNFFSLDTGYIGLKNTWQPANLANWSKWPSSHQPLNVIGKGGNYAYVNHGADNYPHFSSTPKVVSKIKLIRQTYFPMYTLLPPSTLRYLLFVHHIYHLFLSRSLTKNTGWVGHTLMTLPSPITLTWRFEVHNYITYFACDAKQYVEGRDWALTITPECGFRTRQILTWFLVSLSFWGQIAPTDAL